MGKISNVTNSSEPTLVNARLFVGNLNTFVITKEDVENIFQRYGKIIGISMHKGFAFVQYTTELEARNAVQGEDQRVYATQPIDVNLSAEPKPNRPSRKRPPGAGAEWDYYYNLPVARMPGITPTPIKRPCPDLSAMFINPLNPLAAVQATPTLIRPHTTLVPLPGAITANKHSWPWPLAQGNSLGEMGSDQLQSCIRPIHLTPSLSQVMGNPVISTPAKKILTPYRHRTQSSSVSSYKSTISPSSTYSTSSSSTPVHSNGNTTIDSSEDILICGTCKSLFKSLHELTEHKKYKCRLSCKTCASRNTISQEPSIFTCATCHIDFESCWTLCQHCQSEHGIQIFVDTNNKEKCVVNSNSSDVENMNSLAILASSETRNDVPQMMMNSYDKVDAVAVVNGI